MPSAVAQHAASAPGDERTLALLRGQWVGALESVLGVADPLGFMHWLDQHVRPVLGYHVALCATGVFAPRSVTADRLVVRGFPQQSLDAWRDSGGVIVLPRALAREPGCLRPLDCSSVDASLGLVVALDLPESGHRYGSYFLFGQLARLPDARQRYLLDLMAPHMRAALVRILMAEPLLDPRGTARAPLSRRELELLHWLVAGRTTGEIADSTFRSVHTVSNQVRAILRKLRASNRTEAIAVALGLGLVAPLEPRAQTRVMAAQPRLAYRTGARHRCATPSVRAGRVSRSRVIRLDT